MMPSGPKEQPVLVVLTGPQVGQRIRLESAAVIGRDPSADLMLVDEEVAWHHARVERRSEGWAVVDLTEERRTEVNGMRIRELLLTPEDQLIIGATVVRYEVHDPIEQAYDEAVLERLFTDELTGLLARRKFDVEFASAVSAATERGVAASRSSSSTSTRSSRSTTATATSSVRASSPKSAASSARPSPLQRSRVASAATSSASPLPRCPPCQRPRPRPSHPPPRRRPPPLRQGAAALAVRISRRNRRAPPATAPKRSPSLKHADRALYAAKRAGGNCIDGESPT